MDIQPQNWIDQLIETQRSGYSLDQAFYQHPDIFDRDVKRVVCNHWMMAGHVSLIPRQGDELLFEVAGKSIVLVRGPGGTVHAHMNEGLKPCHLAIVEGLIFICLSVGNAPNLSSVVAGLKPFFKLHGIASARVAHRQNFPVEGNWKLAIENYLECYHCKPAHPQYSRVEIKVEKIGDGSPAALKRYWARHKSWQERAEHLGTMIADYSIQPPLDQRLPRAQFGAAYRAPLQEGYSTATEDGLPAAPLMGDFTEYDGGETALALGPFTYMLASNDHAVFFQFIPRDAEHSDMIVSWLVGGDAKEHEDYDLERLTWLWTVTTQQDKTIIEGNAAGIRSSRYQPGPSSLLESDVTGFRNWYLALIGPEHWLSHLKLSGEGRYFGL